MAEITRRITGMELASVLSALRITADRHAQFSGCAEAAGRSDSADYWQRSAVRLSELTDLLASARDVQITLDMDNGDKQSSQVPGTSGWSHIRAD